MISSLEKSLQALHHDFLMKRGVEIKPFAYLLPPPGAVRSVEFGCARTASAIRVTAVGGALYEVC